MNERPYEVWQRRDGTDPWRSVYTGRDKEACQLYVKRYAKRRPAEFLIRKVGHYPVNEDTADVTVS